MPVTAFNCWSMTGDSGQEQTAVRHYVKYFQFSLNNDNTGQLGCHDLWVLVLFLGLAWFVVLLYVLGLALQCSRFISWSLGPPGPLLLITPPALHLFMISLGISFAWFLLFFASSWLSWHWSSCRLCLSFVGFHLVLCTSCLRSAFCFKIKCLCSRLPSHLRPTRHLTQVWKHQRGASHFYSL